MKKYLILVLRLLVAGILLQTLFFKFSGAAESVYIFSALDAEPYGRIGSGVIELIAAVLILSRQTVWGLLLSLGTMTGAILSHIFVLGINVQNDGGLLFTLALITWVSSFYLLLFTSYNAALNQMIAPFFNKNKNQ